MNLIEYVEKFGDKPLSRFNINDADILVLTALTYADLKGVVPEQLDREVKLSDAITRLKCTSISLYKQKYKERLLTALCDSKRFSDLHICGYMDELDNADYAMQFSSLIIKLADDLWFIGYSGTDGTAVGWKEDFQFSYLTQTSAQKKALEYLHKAAETLKGNFIVSGHSKGGNLAAYASIFADKTIQERIKWVYCHDAPGFNEYIDFSNNEGFKKVSSKIISILPQHSIIGQLLETFPEENCRIVYSKSRKTLKGRLYQHDIFRWQIDDLGNVIFLPDSYPKTKELMEKINDQIHQTPMAKREELTNRIFDFFMTKERSELTM